MRAALLVLLLAACAAQGEPGGPTPAMPMLELIGRRSTGIGSWRGAMASDGALLERDHRDPTGRTFSVYGLGDTTAHPVITLPRDEEILPAMVGMSDREIVLLLMDGRGRRPHRLATWARSGGAPRHVVEPPTISGAHFVAGRGVLLVRQDMTGLAVLLADHTSGAVRTLLPATDSAARAVFHPEATGGDQLVRLPVVGAWSGGFYLGQIAEYRLLLYGWDGRFVGSLGRDLGPPRRPSWSVEEAMRDRLRSPSIRSKEDSARAQARIARAGLWIPRLPGPQLDGAGRLWVIGNDGDEPFADLFAGTRFLGRLRLPCERIDAGGHVAGSILAISCVGPSPSFVRTVHTFRIVDVPPAAR